MTQYQKRGSILLILGFIIPMIFISIIFELYYDASTDDLNPKDFYLISLASLFLQYGDYSIPG